MWQHYWLKFRGVPKVRSPSAGSTAVTVLIALSFCHMLNDMMQSLLAAIYPMLKRDYGLDFGQIGSYNFV